MNAHKPIRLIFLINIAALLLASCKIAYYPTSFNAPMMSSKGDAQIAGAIGVGNLEIQTAYALTDNLGAMINGSYFSEVKELTINDQVQKVQLSHNYIEGGLGNFGSIGKIGRYELFVGGGIGTVPADFRNTYFDGSQTANMTKFFIQPALGMRTNMLDFAGVVRLSSIKINNETNYFAEPGVVLKLGYKAVKFYANAGLSLPYHNSGSQSWDHNFFIIGLGVQVNIKRGEKN